MNADPHCPLCIYPSSVEFCRDQKRVYLRCRVCSLVFVPPEHHLLRRAEKAEYDLHQNHVDDPGYRRFLSRLATPLLRRLSPGASGLDFGCGSGPALGAMLEEAGCRVALYDSFYRAEPGLLLERYDFITATEVVEHLHRPGMELARLWSLLRPGGCLGVMTKLVLDEQAFATWHYKNDPTHVCFFSVSCWQWWAQQAGAELEIVGSDVILLGKALDYQSSSSSIFA